MKPVSIAHSLSKAVEALSFGGPVTHVYNPLVYARKPHDAYLERYARPSCEVLLVGMNPGPWGMAQTGVPFGDVGMVREWLGIEGPVAKPAREHPKRPVTGFACHRSEVSGSRLWGWARDRFGDPDRFFARFFVWNYCPLCFMEASGRNFVPEKLEAVSRDPLFEACDVALGRMVDWLAPRYVMGVGKFGEKRARAALDGRDLVLGSVLHPSPASPAANRGWAEAAEAALRAYGIALPE